MKIKMAIGYTEVYDLSKVTPEVFDSLVTCEAYVCVGGDFTRLYYVHWVDKGCDEAGNVYYKGFCCKATSRGGCGHYESLWFNRNNFRKVVGDFINAGGDWTTPAYRRSISWAA